MCLKRELFMLSKKCGLVKGAIVVAGAVVTQNVEPYTLVAGISAKVKKKLQRT